MELPFRLAAAFVLILAPSILFVSFRRGLRYLQDDELIGRLVETGQLDPESIEGFDGATLSSEATEPRSRHDAAKPGRNAGVDARRAALLRDRPSTDTNVDGPADPGSPSVRCAACGARNPPTFSRCWHCLEPIE